MTLSESCRRRYGAPARLLCVNKGGGGGGLLSGSYDFAQHLLSLNRPCCSPVRAPAPSGAAVSLGWFLSSTSCLSLLLLFFFLICFVLFDSPACLLLPPPLQLPTPSECLWGENLRWSCHFQLAVSQVHVCWLLSIRADGRRGRGHGGCS